MPASWVSVNRSGQREFVTAGQRVDVARGAVYAVCAAGVTPFRNGVADQGVHDGAFGFGGDFIFHIGGTCQQAVREVDVGELADGGGSGLLHRAGKVLQLEEIADVRLLDRREGGGVPGVEDRCEAVFDVAGDAVAAEERVGGGDAEQGLYGMLRAGDSREGCGGTKQGKADFHSGKGFIVDKGTKKPDGLQNRIACGPVNGPTDKSVVLT